MRRLIAGTLLFLTAQTAAAGFAEGLAAAERGDYASARREWRPLAEQGHANAQYNLGLMYRNGEGVPKDDVEAVKWYRLAAKQGYANAQYNLGVMYASGEGVPVNYVEAYAWFNIAAAYGLKKAAGGRDGTLERMTRPQVEKAQTRARELWAKYGPKK
jgi:uncharacterized protein